MEHTRNVEGNSHVDSSQPASLPPKDSPKATMELSISLISDEKLKPESQAQNKLTEDSEVAAITNAYDDPATGQNPFISTENADKVGTKDMEIEAGSSNSHYDPTTQSLEGLASKLSDSPKKPNTGDSVNDVIGQVNSGMVPLSASSEGRGIENGVHCTAQSDFTSEHQEVATSVPNNGSETTHPEQDEHVHVVGVIDTAAPIESVKEAVSKFGGILNWKKHKIQAVERQEVVANELGKAQEEIAMYKEQLEAAEDAEIQILNELHATKRLTEDLKLHLEKAEVEERQAKQDLQLAKLRVEELEQGIANEASVAAKAQFEVARDRHTAAITELKAVKDELEKMQAEDASLAAEKAMTGKRAVEAVAVSQEVEMTVEELSLELLATKEALESAHAAHLEAEEQRTTAAMAKEKENNSLEKDLKQAEEKMHQLNQQLQSKEDLKLKLDASTELLLSLKTELAACSNEGSNQGRSESITSAKDVLEKVRLNIDKARAEVDRLNGISASLESELEREKSELVKRKQTEGKTAVADASVEAKLNETKAEVTLVRMKEKEAREKMVELPDNLRQAAKEADQTKLVAELAHEELTKAKEEADQLKASASNMESKLHAAKKERAAAIASEKLALGAVKALEESESAAIMGAKKLREGVSLPLEEYYALSKKAHTAEEQEDMRVEAAISQVEEAKESQLRTSEKSEEMNREMEARNADLQNALEKAEKADQGKLVVEQELRDWRSEQEQQRSGSEADQGVPNSRKSPMSSSEPIIEPKTSESQVSEAVESNTTPKISMTANDTETESSQEVKAKKKKRSWFPRIIMFFSRRKAHDH